MTVLPPSAPLPLPPGDPAALAELVDTATGAAFRLGVLTAHLAGPAVSAPGWLGADAAASAAQIGAVAVLTGRVHAAVTEAIARLARHRDLLLDGRARVLAWRADQREDFAAAAARLAAPALPGGPDAGLIGVVDDLAAADAARARAHAALLAEVEADAAATATVLGAATTPVGGAGRPGDADSVTAWLATLLPGWGHLELAARGRADGVAARRSSPEEIGALLAGASPLLGSAAYAEAWLTALGARAFVDLLRAIALPAPLPGLPGHLAAMVTAALPAAATGPAADPRLHRVLDAPLRGPLDASLAVGLGRLAGAGSLPAAYLARLVGVLAGGERRNATLRRDQLAVTPGEDPLATVLAALADTQDAGAAARTLASADLWPVLLGRTWTEGFDGIDRLLRLAARGELAPEAAATVLEAIGGVVDVVVTQISAGSPEAFSLASISPAVGALVAPHLGVVTDAIAVGLSLDGVPSRPLEEAERRMLAGLGMLTLDPEARATVLRSLVRATTDAPPPVGPGAQSAAAYVHGGVFAAMAFGEAQQIRRQLFSAVTVAENHELCWNVVTAPLGWINVPRLRRTWAVVTSSTSFLGPGDVPLGDFLREPATGAPQAAFSAVVASVPALVEEGLLPDPGPALDHGLGSPEGRRYEADLEPRQFEVWDDVVSDAESGFLDVGDALGILPGSG